MPPKVPWIERIFVLHLPVSMAPNLIERLRGTPARLEDRLRELAAAALRRQPAERWSILQNVGHLVEVEALWLGRLDDLEGLKGGGRHAGIVLSAFVYHHRSPGPLRANHEVEEAFWVSLSVLSDPARRVEYTHPLLLAETFPGILVGDPDRHVVWGLTFRFVESFLSVADRSPSIRRGVVA